MDSHHTTQMLMSRDIRVLHLEATDVCQAACPQCARETDAVFDARRHHSLSIDQLQALLPEPFIRNLHKMFMCGNYGDPAASSHTLRIYRWFREINPEIVLGMNSNGALQTTFWWHELAGILDRPQDYVIFGIDGLEDTNHLYRVNVNWRRLLANAEAFIAAGGSAHWDMLVFEHNQHQVDACQRLAQDMGFRWFRAKVSKRPMVGRLRSPMKWADPIVKQGIIKCRALSEQSVYIDAQARISPCCWLGSRQKDFVTDFDVIQQTWQTDHPEPTCEASCRADTRGTSFENQFQRVVQF